MKWLKLTKFTDFFLDFLFLFKIYIKIEVKNIGYNIESVDIQAIFSLN